MIEAVWYGVIASFSFLGLLFVILLIYLRIFSFNKVAKVVFYVDQIVPENRVIDLIYGVYIRRILLGKMISDEMIVISDSLNSDFTDSVIGAVHELDCFDCTVNIGSLSLALREENDEKRIM